MDAAVALGAMLAQTSCGPESMHLATNIDDAVFAQQSFLPDFEVPVGNR